MTMTTVKKLTLRCSDGETFEVEENVAVVCQTLRHMVEDDCAGNTIPIPNVNGAIFAKVLEYCKKHINVVGGENNSISSKNTSNGEEKSELREWDREFANVDSGTLFDLILAANYLNIRGLLDLTCQTVADYIKDKQVDEVRELFSIKNDFTPEEEAAVRSENQWAFD